MDDDINFWSHQIAEHNLFIFLGLVDDGKNNVKELRNLAYSLYQDWTDFRKQYLENEDSTGIDKLLDAQEKLESDIKSLQDKNIWIGYLYPAFVQHMIDEREYFIKRISDGLTQEEEIEFWNHHDATEIAAESHMLDPTETKLYDTMDALRKNFESSTYSENAQAYFLTLASQYSDLHENLKSLLKDNKLKSVMNMDLIEHAAREGLRGTKIIEQ